MVASKLVKNIGYFTKLALFSKISTKRIGQEYVLEFLVRTTQTRASSMVTRLRLIVAEMAQETQFSVDKELLSDAPKTRSSISLWRIYATIPIKKVRKNLTNGLRSSNN